MPADYPDIRRRPSTKRLSTTESVRRGRGPPDCRVSGCYKSAIPLGYEDQIFVSQFCKDHTCDWQYSPYEASCCPNPVLVKGQKLCDNHEKLLSCAHKRDSCVQKREYYEVGDSQDPAAPWFCSAHRCGHEGCEQEGIGTEKGTRRCDKHKLCSVPGCKSPPDAQNYSLLCKQHTCRSAPCPNVAKKNNLCTEHQRCDYEGCSKPRYWPDTGLDDPEAPPLCERHFKEQSRCQRSDCRRPKESGKGRFCSEHEYRCKKEGCSNPLVNSSGTGGSFCPKHTCKVPSCQRSTTSGTSSHCDIHSCTKPKCANPAETTASPTTPAGKPLPPLCRIHKCKVASCAEEATPISETTAGYCLAKHGCIETDCQKGRIYDDQGTPFERCADHERQRWKDAGRRDAEEAREAEDAVRKKNELKKDREHKKDKDDLAKERDALAALKNEIRQLKDIIHGPEGVESFRQELEDLRIENAQLRADTEGLRSAHDAHQTKLRKRRPSMPAANGFPPTAPGPGGYSSFGPPGGHAFAGPGPMPIPGMNGSRIGRESPTSRSFRGGGSTWDTSRDSLLSHQYDDHEYPYYSEEDRGGTPTDISFDHSHSSEHDPSQPSQRGRIRDVPVDWDRQPRARDARELRDKSRGRPRGGTNDTFKDTMATIAQSPRDKSNKPATSRRTKSKHRGATGGYGAYDALKRRSGGAALGQWQAQVDASQVAQQPPPLSARKSRTFGGGTGKPRPVSMAGSVPDYAGVGLGGGGGYGGPPGGHVGGMGHMGGHVGGGYWGQMHGRHAGHVGHGEFYDSEE
ncbi:hypothetical protein B0T20DRAFT_351422 [Sordaria brevicollis]|uniref:Uncharacterized protein n=1 Tax=Sordaria brevicollis TaxID=83679 RepID=A0AAE0UD80_SORBR|nr:hypothetical protein B0T20DRAFT_351422 [Sordaria brevicollis]